jgi:hypothetical protein
MWWWIGLLTVAGLVVGVAVVARKPKLRRAVVRVVKKQVKRRITTTQRARRAVRQPAKAPLANRSQRPGKPSVVRPTKCSAACRMSRKDLYDKEGRLACDCPCQGRYHGMYKPGSNASLRGKGRVSGAPAPKKTLVSKPAALPAPAVRTSTATKPKPTAVPQQRSSDVPVRSVAEKRGWKSLRPDSLKAMTDHAAASPRCVGGTASALTIRDRRTNPPTVTQKLTCDTCKAQL